MSEILFLSHRIPFPPDRGDKIRSHHILKALAEIAPVHVGTFGETESDMAQGDELAEIAQSHHLACRSLPLPIAGLLAVLRGDPVSLAAFRDENLLAWISTTLAERPISIIYVFSGQMGQYIPVEFSGKVVLDLVDVDSAKFESYSETGAWPRSAIDKREGRLLRAEEERLAYIADCTVLVSDAEASFFKNRLSQADKADVRALCNGIDAQYFAPEQSEPEAQITVSNWPHFVFTGQMDYAPNIAAVKRMAREILPEIRKVHSNATFHIVGRAPTPELLKLDGVGGVRVWGSVPDMRPFLAAADIVVAPLTIARGVQNKVLEAMAMARPVLISSEAATGIDAQAGTHFEVADCNTDFIASALAMLDDAYGSRAMGQAGRAFVLQHRSWPAMLAELPAMMGLPVHQELSRHAV